MSEKPFDDVLELIEQAPGSARKENALARLCEAKMWYDLAKDVEPAPPPVDQPEAPTEPDAPEKPKPTGSMRVADGSGAPGERVVITLYGEASIPVMGFAAAIGFEDRDLKFVGAEWPGFWGVREGRAKVLQAKAFSRGEPGAGNAGPNIQLGIQRVSFDADPGEDPGAVDPGTPGETHPPVDVTGGPIVHLMFDVIRTSPKVCQLLLETRKYGDTKLIIEFTTDKADSPDSIEPSLESGQIIVK